MANGRFLSKTIANSAQLASVSDAAEVLFYRMLPHADVDGRLEGNLDLIRSMAFPLKKTWAVRRIAKYLAELAGSRDPYSGEPLVLLYHGGGKQVVQFPGFARHQKLRRDREAASRLAGPDEDASEDPEKREARAIRRNASRRRRNPPGVVRESSGSGPGALRVKSSEVQVQGEGEGLHAGSEDSRTPGGWPARFAAIFAASIGTFDPGEIGVHFGPAVKLHGEEAVERGLKAWAQQAPHTEKPQFLTPKSAARQIGAWVARTKPIRIYDSVSGDPTPETLAILGRKS